MEKKASKVKSFFKKNVYYIIMAVCLLAIAAMVTVTVLVNNGTIGKPKDNVNEQTDTPTIGEDPTDKPTENPSGEQTPAQQTDKEPEETVKPDPTPTAVVFASPVENANMIQGYAMDTLVWNATLKHYAVHNGIDFGGNDGDNVLCAYDGVVASVTYDVLNGHTVTIKHNDELSTVYSSLNEPVVSVGQAVRKGNIIGTMGTTATAEYSSGAHLHFSVLENGSPTDPNLYLAENQQK